MDLQALRDAAVGVNATLIELDRRSVGDISHDESAIGNHDVAKTLSDFLGRWQRGVTNLAKDGKEIRDRLTASANAYTKAEQDVQQHLTQSNGVVTGAGNDPGVK
ncbi:hypothetical protein ACFYNO_06135 [Kitasatospora sp. NPDC006697]|uniref:hypothetical protein n=1 Tax=Kitasatospora sp. NPDC006697 TaxID=3364020 RepID=UPI00368BB35D